MSKSSTSAYYRFIIFLKTGCPLMSKASAVPVTQKVFGENSSNHSIYKPDNEKQQRIALTNQIKRFDSQNPKQSVFESVGVIRSNWYNQSKQLITYTYGTAFHVTPRVIMTCTHNIYSSFRNRFADQIQFLPNIKEGLVMHQSRNIKKSINKGYYQNFFPEQKIQDSFRSNMKEKLNFQYKPKKQQITLIALTETKIELTETNILQGQTFGIPIGNLKESLMNTQTNLKIVGYPSEYYRTQMKFTDAKVNRVELNGNFHSIQYYNTENDQKRLQILNHTMETRQGFSGSPILACHEGKYYAIGIHTHRGRSIKYNSGVYFDLQFLNVVEEFNTKIMNELKIRYKNPEEFKQEKITIIKFQQRQKDDHFEQDKQKQHFLSQTSQMEDPLCSQSGSDMCEFGYGLLKYLTIQNLYSTQEQEDQSFSEDSGRTVSDSDEKEFQINELCFEENLDKPCQAVA